MDSVVGTCVVILAIIHVSAAFVHLDCKAENHGQHGEDSILKCNMNLKKEATDATIKWVTWKKKGNVKPLVVFKDHQLITNDPRFRFAVGKMTVTTRNVSLVVSKTQINDSGTYECMVWTDRGPPDTVEINLIVTARYGAPNVGSIPEKDTSDASLTLICNSEGGYPEGTIHWFDQNNKEWTSSSHLEPKQMDDQRFILTSTLTLSKIQASPQSFRCSVYNNATGDKVETTFELPQHAGRGGDQKGKDPKPSTIKIVAPVVVIGSLIVGLLLIQLLLKRRRSNGDHTLVPRDAEEASLQEGMDAERGKTCEHGEGMNTLEEEGHQAMIP